MLIDSFESLPQEYFGPGEKLVILQNYNTRQANTRSPPESFWPEWRNIKTEKKKNIFKKKKKKKEVGKATILRKWDFPMLLTKYEEYRGGTNR